MGGYLARPARYYPNIFPPDGLFGKYPYLLPNLVCVVAIAIAVVQGAIFLKETNPMMAEAARVKAMAERNSNISERTPLTNRDSKDADATVAELNSPDSIIRRKPSMLQEEGLPSTTDPHFDLRRSSFGTMHSIKIQPPSAAPSSRLKHQKPDLRTTFNFTVVMLIGSLVLCSYHSMGYFNLLPIYLLDEPHRNGASIDLQGGLGYDIHAVGSFMAVNGIISVLVQAIVFPIFVGKVGVWKSYVTMIVLYPLTYPLMPLLTLLPFDHGLRAAGIYAIMVIQNHLNIIIPPCALILIKNATPSPLVLGTVNGACMSLLSAARTAAPPLEGIIYSAGGSAAAWFSLMGVTVVAVVQLAWIPRERATQVGGIEVDAEGFMGRDVEEGEEVRLLRQEEAVED